MGLFWDLIQQGQLDRQRAQSESLESRVATLEAEIDRLQALLRTVVERLERHVAVDLNDDGRVG